MLPRSRAVIRGDEERGGSQAGHGARSLIGFIEHYRRAANQTTVWAVLVETAREIKDQQVLSPVLGMATTIAHDSGDEAGVIAFADEYQSGTIDVYRTWFLPWVTGPLARLGDADRIERLLDGTAVIGSHARVGKARAEGHLAEARGDTEAAAERFLAAVAIAADFRRPVDAMLARIDAARVLGADPRAVAVAAEARQAAERMGAHRLLAELDDIEGRSSERAAGA